MQYTVTQLCPPRPSVSSGVVTVNLASYESKQCRAFTVSAVLCSKEGWRNFPHHLFRASSELQIQDAYRSISTGTRFTSVIWTIICTDLRFSRALHMIFTYLLGFLFLSSAFHLFRWTLFSHRQQGPGDISEGCVRLTINLKKAALIHCQRILFLGLEIDYIQNKFSCFHSCFYPSGAAGICIN